MRSIFLSIVLTLFLIIVFAMQDSKQTAFTSKLKSYCDSVASEFNQIPKERKKTLTEIITYAKKKLETEGGVQLMFICTHNSRRSQFGQVWAATAAKYYGIEGVKTYSGGIEVTACNPRTIDALKRVGFSIVKKSEGINPQYEVKSTEKETGSTLYSKLYGDFSNPRGGFAAIMVCSDADEKCPLVQGAEERISLPYDDPKAFDNTSQEAEKYDDRCRQIAREVFYVFASIK
jgi:hypothetical protein